jgi:Xaa-Pro aminopeptidase
MPRPDHEQRVSSLREAFVKKGLDGVVVTSHNDIYYYTGKALARGDPGFLLVTRKGKTLYVSFLDNELEGQGVKIINKLKGLKRDFQKAGRLGFDEMNMSVYFYRRIKSGSWKFFSDELKALRMVKDRHEISLLRRAAKETSGMIKSLRIRGKTEFEVASDILRKMREKGFEPAFDPIVASGKYSAFVHHIPGKALIRKGLVIVDTGLKHKRYNSDVTRTFCFGLNRAEERMVESCRNIQAELIDMARPGISFSKIQKRYEGSLKFLGYQLMHSFGHGVGLGVHERPRGNDILEKGMVITVEPGIYRKGVGGCRIEDMVLVKDKPEVLSRI